MLEITYKSDILENKLLNKFNIKWMSRNEIKMERCSLRDVENAYNYDECMILNIQLS